MKNGTKRFTSHSGEIYDKAILKEKLCTCGLDTCDICTLLAIANSKDRPTKKIRRVIKNYDAKKMPEK